MLTLPASMHKQLKELKPQFLTKRRPRGYVDESPTAQDTFDKYQVPLAVAMFAIQVRNRLTGSHLGLSPYVYTVW